MSNITMFKPSNVPSFAKNAVLSATTLALAGGVNTGTGMKRISIKGGVFRLLSFIRGDGGYCTSAGLWIVLK